MNKIKNILKCNIVCDRFEKKKNVDISLGTYV